MLGALAFAREVRRSELGVFAGSAAVLRLVQDGSGLGLGRFSGFGTASFDSVWD